jgi:hypothetical protein
MNGKWVSLSDEDTDNIETSKLWHGMDGFAIDKNHFLWAGKDRVENRSMDGIIFFRI